MGWGGFLVITVSHPTFCCVGVGLWLRWGWAVTIYIGDNVKKHDSPETDIKVDEMIVTSGGKQYAETEI